LENRDEFESVTITLEPDEELNAESERYFPAMIFDNWRVWLRKGEHSINVLGVVQGGKYHLRAHAYKGHSPWGTQFFAPVDELESVVEHCLARFDELQ
jgi:hypothetical protein